METSDEPVRAGVREQRRRRTRQTLLDKAEELFAARGYDQVTVAEIANAAGVSVKTLFQYFRSKEDLLFGEQDQVQAAIVAVLHDREAQITPLVAMTRWLLTEVDRDPAPDGVERYHRTVGTSPAVASRLRRLWEDYENAIARELANEANEATPSPATRLIAAQLTAMMRVTTSPEVREFVARHPTGDPRAAMRQWVHQASEIVGRGIDQSTDDALPSTTAAR